MKKGMLVICKGESACLLPGRVIRVAKDNSWCDVEWTRRMNRSKPDEWSTWTKRMRTEILTERGKEAT